MKRLVLRRHGDKAGDQISQEGLDWFRDNDRDFETGMVTDVFCGSEIGRTAQTALAAVVYWHIYPERVHAAVSGLGNDAMVQTLLEAGFRQKHTEFGDNLLAARACLDPATYRRMQRMTRDGIILALAAMPDDAIGLAFGHSPFIEMAAEMCEYDMQTELASYKGLVFIETIGGIIDVGPI